MSRLDTLSIIFAGTPQFAVPFLDAIINSPHELLAVYTQPDKPAGRGLHLTSSPVKKQALTYQLPIYQPTNFRDNINQQQLQQLKPDILIDIAYGVLLPPEVLSIPRFGCINVHPSLLPRWRGAAPIQRAILAGDAVTGISIMQMDKGLDTGNILQQQAITIDPTDTTSSLANKLIKLGIDLLLDTLQKIRTHSCTSIPQEDQCSTYATKITKEEAKINWQKSAIEIDRIIRAFNPWPIAYSEIDQHTVRIWQAIPIAEYDRQTELTKIPGSIIAAGKNGIDVTTGSGILRILQLQLPGKKVLPVKDILNAHADLFAIGKVFT